MVFFPNEPVYGESTHKMARKMSGKFIELILKNPSVSIPQLASKIGVADRTIERNIQKLKNENILKRVGGAKGGHWQVLENYYED